MELIPTPDSISVPAGWFNFLLISTFMIHILLMNIMVGSSIIAFFSSFKQTSGSHELERDISAKLTFVISLAINFGVAPLLFLQVLYGHFMYVSSMLMAVFWLSVIVLLIIAYYTAYYYKFNFEPLPETDRGVSPFPLREGGRGLGRRYFIGAAALIFLCIAFFFSNNMTLMLNPSAWTAYFGNPGGTILNLSDPVLLPRFLHFMIASAAIGGLFTAIVWKLKKNHPASEENIILGMKWFTYSTMIQIIVGFLFQMSLPQEIIGLFMGQSSPHTILFLISLCFVVITLFYAIRRNVWASSVSVLFLIFFMIIMRDMVRTAYLKPFFALSDLQVQPQYSPMIFFMMALIIGVGVMVYVIRLAVKTYMA